MLGLKLTSVLLIIAAVAELGECQCVVKLPLCKLNKEFAATHAVCQCDASSTSSGSEQSRTVPVSVPERRPSPQIKTSARFVPPIKVTTTTTTEAATTTTAPSPPRRSRPRFSNDGACKGLRFCTLRKNRLGASDTPTRPTTPRPATTEAVFIAPVDSGPSNGDLLDAILNGHIDDAKALLKDGADVNAEDVHGNSALLIASQNGRVGIIDDLLLGGAKVNHGNNHKNTALHLAAQNGWTEIASKLMRAKKININAIDLHANTALHLAAQNGQIGVTQVLIDRPEIQLTKPNTHGQTALHLAAQNGHLELSRMLVQAGSDLDYADLIGNTPLHTAVHATFRNIANMLVQAGANERKKNLSGLTPFQLG